MIMSVDGSLSSASLEYNAEQLSTKTPETPRSTPVGTAAATYIAADATTPSDPKMADSDLLTKPKRPLSAYNMFFRDQRELLLESLPSRCNGRKPKRSHGKINFNDLAKTIAAKWKTISPAEKKEYEKVAAVGREKYVKLAKEYKKQQRKLAKRKKRAEAKAAPKIVSGVTVPITNQRAGSFSGAPNISSHEIMNSRHNVMNEIMTGRVASSRFYPGSHHDGYGLGGNQPPFMATIREQHALPREISMNHTKGEGFAACEQMPAFDELELEDDVQPQQQHQHQQPWNELMMAHQRGMFGYPTQQQQRPLAMGYSVRLNPPCNTFAFAFDNQNQRHEATLNMMRPSTSLPQINTTGSNLNAMESPRRLNSLPFVSTSYSEQLMPSNATWERTMECQRMFQQSLPFPPASRNSCDLYNMQPLRPQAPTANMFPTVFEHGASEQSQMITDNFSELQPEPLPFDFSNEVTHSGTFQQSPGMDSDYMNIFQDE